jgi:hypothetical protein
VTEQNPAARLFIAQFSPASPAPASQFVTPSPSPAASHPAAFSAAATVPPPLTGRPLRGRGEPRRPEPMPWNSAATPRHRDEPPMPSPVAKSSSAPPITHVPDLQGLPSADTSLSAPGFYAAPERAIEHSPLRPPSRLGGLRNLLIALGLRSLHQEAEMRGFSPEPVSHAERGKARISNADPSQSATDAGHVQAGFSPTRLTSMPEFLPPKPAVETDREKPPSRIAPVPLPMALVDTSDEIETLPSWRGQYRKKRYPPV